MVAVVVAMVAVAMVAVVVAEAGFYISVPLKARKAPSINKQIRLASADGTLPPPLMPK
jgi:hypothetical protein